MQKNFADLPGFEGKNLRVTPLICLFHGGSMAKAAHETAERWPLGPGSQVVHFVADTPDKPLTPDVAAEACLNTLTAEYSARIQTHSLTFRNDALPWIAIWCEGTPAIQSFIETLRAKLIEAKEQFRRCPIVIYADSLDKLSDAARYTVDAQRYKYDNDHWIVCSPKSLKKYSDTVRGRSTWAHVASSWQKFWETGADSPLDMLGLGGNCWAHDLAIGYDAPDIDWLIAHYSKFSYTELVEHWLRPASSVTPPALPTLKNLSNDVLEKTPYVTTEEKDSTATAIITPADPILSGPVILRMKPDARQTELPRTANRGTWGDHRSKFEEYEVYLRLVLHTAAQRQTTTAASRSLTELQAIWNEYFKPSTEAAGLFDDLKKQAAHATHYATSLERSEVSTESTTSKLDDRIREIDDAVMDVPAPWGLVLRWALILVGVIWLSFGTFFWENGATPFTSTLLRWVFFGGIAGVVALGGAAAIKYYYSNKLVETLISRVINEIRYRHLREVCVTIVERLCGLGVAFGQGVSFIEKKLEEIADALKKTLAKKEAEKTNLNPRFGLGAVEALWAKTREKIIPFVHEKVVTIIKGPNDGLLDAATWEMEGRNTCQAVSSETLKKLTYQDWCELGGISDAEKRLLVESLLNDATQASTPGALTDNSRPVFIGPIEMAVSNGVLKNLQSEQTTNHLLRHPALPWLIVIQPLPLLNTKIEEAK